jgi:hypothetical protein
VTERDEATRRTELYLEIGRSIVDALGKAETLGPVWVKIYNRLGALFVADDFEALHAEFMRVDALIREGRMITPPERH